MASKMFPSIEYHERGEVKYEWLGEYWEFTVKHSGSGNTFIDACTRLNDARRLVATMIGKKI